MKKSPILIFIILFLGMYLFKYIPIELFNINYENLNITNKIIYNFICDISFIIIIFIINYKTMINSLKEYINNFKKIMLPSFKYYFIGLFLMIITNIIIGSSLFLINSL